MISIILIEAIRVINRYMIIIEKKILVGHLRYFVIKIVNSLLDWVNGAIFCQVGSIIVILVIETRIRILNEKLNFSFDATLVIYINNTIKPPTIIMKRMYEYQEFEYFRFALMAIMRVCIKIKIPAEMGCLTKGITVGIIIILDKISKNSLSKILILEISDKDLLFL